MSIGTSLLVLAVLAAAAMAATSESIDCVSRIDVEAPENSGFETGFNCVNSSPSWAWRVYAVGYNANNHVYNDVGTGFATMKATNSDQNLLYVFGQIGGYEFVNVPSAITEPLQLAPSADTLYAITGPTSAMVAWAYDSHTVVTLFDPSTDKALAGCTLVADSSYGLGAGDASTLYSTWTCSDGSAAVVAVNTTSHAIASYAVGGKVVSSTLDRASRATYVVVAGPTGKTVMQLARSGTITPITMPTSDPTALFPWPAIADGICTATQTSDTSKFAANCGSVGGKNATIIIPVYKGAGPLSLSNFQVAAC
ncbi:uncharacterized protein AMSG_01655 [Thecamonas trahens ATCC 50062]|uniref:Uncharacterized protein n=1 Tax=Thecamonas trahens ATCC 50062 TaxID=461836 RepID=A0A0L0DRC3_THETB|nr:hypothetical protein AMSG_01655 [Thecamonas trahens ATCC 50062]KNC54802.1 hypothetical protein AMSG_01655 [Thecamonas trahens ATCC 50062]|eukprot:XP_013761702.1 hypothetical protein AMSG_01655 [Thecamonas trahens ATCC 50062]